MGLTDQQPVLRCDLGRNPLRPDAVALLLQAQRPRDVHSQRTIDPRGEVAIVIDVQVVTARQDRNPRARRRRAIEDDVAEMSAGVHGHDDVSVESEARPPRARTRTRCARRGGATRRGGSRADERVRASAPCPPRSRRETSRREGASPAREGRDHLPDRRCARRERDAGRAAPSPTPRRAPCAADSPRGTPHEPTDERACCPGIGPDRGR